MNTYCLVAQGGGMVACYHVGVISALKNKFGFKTLEHTGRLVIFQNSI
jgi:predicted patatin/cPLA2 family phospholipase